MNRARSLAVLAVVTVVVVIAVVVVTPRMKSSGSSADEPLFPALLPVINDVTGVVVTHEGNRFSARHIDGAWVMPERGNYPVSESAVRNLIVAVAGTRKLQAMTSKPERYAKLGLGDPETEDSYAVRYQLESDEGRALATVIIGYRNPSKVDDKENEIYVRAGDDPQSWLVESKVPHHTEPADLLERTVASIDLARVRSVSVRHPDGEEIRVSRPAPGEGSFTLDNPPADTQVLYDWAIDDFGRVFTELELDDVRPENEVEFGTELMQLELSTFDGLELQMQSSSADAGQFARLRATTGARTPGVEHESLRTAKEVEAQALSLGQAWAGWAFQFTGYRYDTFTKRMSELVTAIDETASQ